MPNQACLMLRWRQHAATPAPATVDAEFIVRILFDRRRHGNALRAAPCRASGTLFSAAAHLHETAALMQRQTEDGAILRYAAC